MDSRQTGPSTARSVRRVLRDRTAGHLGRGNPGPSISLYSPREMTALYQDPEADEWPMLALGVDGNRVYLFDEEMRYEFGIETAPVRGRPPRRRSTSRPAVA
jgi:hypothetical protein